MERRKEEERCRFFVPNGAQERFIKELERKDIFIGLFIAANGVGKDAVMANICANVIWGPQNEWFNADLFKEWPFPRRIRIGTESSNMQDSGSVDTEIGTWWPKDRYRGLKIGKLYTAQYKTDTGFLVDKMSYEQEKKEWESATLGMACFSEPPPKEIFAATVGRMRKGGLILFFMTPLTHSAWIQDDLVDAHDQKTFVVGADIEDNCKQHGVRGILEHGHIVNMMEHWDPEEVDARAHGRFTHLSSVILGKSFNRMFHVVGDDLEAPAGSQWGMLADPARGKPWAMAWFWVDKRGQMVVDHEYPEEDFSRMRESNLGLGDYNRIIRFLDQGRPMEWRVIDRHFANVRDQNGRTLRGQLAEEFGLDFMDSYEGGVNEIEVGIQGVKTALAFDRDRTVDTLNYPRLLIKERCKNTIRALERWSRNPKTLEPDRLSPYKDHFDLVRYLCMAKPEVYVSAPMESRRIGYVLGR
jgi:phage terminase large subunit-like protein